MQSISLAYSETSTKRSHVHVGPKKVAFKYRWCLLVYSEVTFGTQPSQSGLEVVWLTVHLFRMHVWPPQLTASYVPAMLSVNDPMEVK